MFDEGMKITVFGVGALALILSLGGQSLGPRAPIETAVSTADLPPVPLTASATGAPAQTRVTSRQVPLGAGFEATLLYAYALEGRVVSRREFRNDPTSAISPLDLGIVYGALAEPGRAAAISFKAAPRVLFSRPEPGADLPASWHDLVTNNHLIPADQAVNDALLAIAPGARVRIRGYLVEVTGNGLLPWRSSTRRDDATIIGGCEIILVTGVEILPADGDAA